MTRIRVKPRSFWAFNTEDGTEELSGEALVKHCLANEDEARQLGRLAEIVGRLLEQHVPVDQWLAVCQPCDLEQVK